MKKSMVALAVAFGATALIAASAQNKGTIKIVSQTPLSGGQAKNGGAIKSGAELAIEEFKPLITSQGYKLVFEPYDDQAKPDIGTANANKIINDADVLGVVGHLNSGVAIPSSEVYAKVGLVMVSPANTNVRVTDRLLPNVNRICGRDDVQGAAAADYALKTLKAKTFYVLNDKTPYGQGVADSFEAFVKGAGGQVIYSGGFDAQERDFSSVLNRAKAENPQVVFYGGIYDQGGPLLKQMRAKGVQSTLLGADGLDGTDFQALAGPENMKNTYFSTTAVPISYLPAAKKFAQKYQAKYNVEPEGYAAYGYDSARVVITGIANAIKAASGARPTREAVSAAVRKVTFSGITGKIAFNGRGDLAVAKYLIIEPQADYANNKVVKSVSVAAPEPAAK